EKAYNRGVPKTEAFQSTFDTLRALFTPYGKTLTVVKETPTAYYLASKTSKTKSGAAIWFGGVEIKKNYVSLHLITVYGNPALADTLSPALRQRMQGKSCFNFTTLDPVLLKELAALTKKGYAGFTKQFP